MNLKRLNLTVLLVTILVLVPTIQIVYSQSAGTFYLSGGIYPQGDYTIWKEGSYYYAKNIYGLQPSWSGSTNASSVIQSALDSLSSGRIWQETVVVLGGSGGYSLSTTVILDSYTVLDLTNSWLYLDDDSDCHMFTNKNWTYGGEENSDQYIEIRGGNIDANGDSQTGDVDALHFESLWRSNILTSFISNGKRYNIYLKNCEQMNIRYNRIAGAGVYAQLMNGMDFSENEIVAGSTNNGLFVSLGYGSKITNNYIYGSLTGIEFWDTVEKFVVSGNTIDENYGHGIRAYQGFSNNTVSDNIIMDCDRSGLGYSGIALEDAGTGNSNNTFIGNRIYLGSLGQVDYGIKEANNADQNIFLGCHAYGSVMGISVVGSNTKVTDCWNGSTWIGAQEGAKGDKGEAGAGNFGDYTFIVYQNGSNTESRDWQGQLQMSSTNDSGVINDALETMDYAGVLHIKKGTYDVDYDIMCYGNGEGEDSGDNQKELWIVGEGSGGEHDTNEGTILKGGSGVNVIHVLNGCRLHLRSLKIWVPHDVGGYGIYGEGDYNSASPADCSIYQGSFKNIRVKKGNTNSWLVYLENPEMLTVEDCFFYALGGNNFRVHVTANADYNYGHCSFRGFNWFTIGSSYNDRIALQFDGGTKKVNHVDISGDFNIRQGGSATGKNGTAIVGYNLVWSTINNIHFENVDNGIVLQSSGRNIFSGWRYNYVCSGGTYLSIDSSCYDNVFEHWLFVDCDGQTVIDDACNNANFSTTLRDSEILNCNNNEARSITASTTFMNLRTENAQLDWSDRP